MRKFFIVLIFCFNIYIKSENAGIKKEDGLQLNNSSKQSLNDTIITNNTSDYKLPDEILEHYAHYKALEEYMGETCNYESIIEDYSEIKLKEKIGRERCIPNWKTLAKILELGWTELGKYLVTEVYLPKLIDPTRTIYTYIKKYETGTRKLNYLLGDLSKYENIQLNYKYENFDDNVKVTVQLPDASYIVEYLSIYCYKDLLKIHGIFRTRNKLVRIKDSKTLFDAIDNECEYNYNSFDHQIEINLNKVNKLKKWTKLFK